MTAQPANTKVVRAFIAVVGAINGRVGAHTDVARIGRTRIVVVAVCLTARGGIQTTGIVRIATAVRVAATVVRRIATRIGTVAAGIVRIATAVRVAAAGIGISTTWV